MLATRLLVGPVVRLFLCFFRSLIGLLDIGFQALVFRALLVCLRHLRIFTFVGMEKLLRGIFLAFPLLNRDRRGTGSRSLLKVFQATSLLFQ